MNIPRQFYGINYVSKLIERFQDVEMSDIPELKFHEIEDVKEIPLEQEDTGALGLNSKRLSKMLRQLTYDHMCALDGIAVAKDEKLVFAGYRPPYSAEIRHITNSTCKTVTAIGIMFAISEGRLHEDDLVASFFPEYENVLTPKYVKEMTIQDLLTMRSGSKCSEFSAMVETNWVQAFLMTECSEEPGTRFVYNSMDTYMLSAILIRVTGESLMDYLKPRFFEPLGINHIKWELCPEGYERGGWGLYISLEGMLKIGIFLANDGAYLGRQLIDPSYIRKMKDTKIVQDTDKLATGYAYQLWHLPKGLYMLSGMYGQHVIIDEKHKLIIATNAHSDKLFPDSKLVRTILDCMTDEELYRPESAAKEGAAYRRLLQDFELFHEGFLPRKPENKMPYLAYYKNQQLKRAKEKARLRELLSQFDGRRLHIDQATIKLFPYMLQGMYQCPPYIVTDIAFRLQDNAVKICFYKERTRKERRENSKREQLILTAGLNEYHTQTLPVAQQDMEVAIKAYPAMDEDDNAVVKFDMVFPSAGFSRLLKFFIYGDRIGIECMEYPDMRAIMERVLYGEAVIGGNTIDLTNKLPDSIRVFLEHKVEPSVNAYLSM